MITIYYRRQWEAYNKHLERLGYSKGTQERYGGCLKDFFRWLEAAHIREAQEICSAHIEAYKSHEEERPNKMLPGTPGPAHIQTSLQAIRVWMNYLHQTGQIRTNPVSVIRIGSVRHEPRDILTLAEIKELYGVCENLRERALLSLFYGCGLRRSEAEKLNIRDVHFRSGLLYVREGKGRKRRVIPMSATVSKELKDYYMQERSSYIGHTTADNQQAFILGEKGNRMRGNTLHKKLRRIVERITTTKHITTHGLRHSIATHLLESGMSLEYVRDFLGHEFIDTTQIYTRITARQLQTI